MTDTCFTYTRPKTRGELKRRLENGETCEIVADNAEITTTLLHGWLNFNAFTVELSPNRGWCLFVPNVPKEKEHADS